MILSRGLNVHYTPHTDDSKEFDKYIYIEWINDRIKPSIEFRRDIEPLLNKISSPLVVSVTEIATRPRVAAVYN